MQTNDHFMRKIILLLLLFGSFYPAFSQGKKITGIVINKVTREPLQGASVQVRDKAVVTDSKGRFTISAIQGQTIAVSYVGLKTINVRVENNTSEVSVEMEEDANKVEEVVVTGYKSEKKKDLTGAVSVVNLKDIKDVPSGNPMQSLQGRVPGLYIEANGNPAGRNSRILIRGLNTLGNTDPLYVIDGVPTKRADIFQNMNPGAIESVQILKDASAASIYGSRASNGVIIITTKEGKGKDRLQVQVNSNVSFENYTSSLKMLSTLQRGQALWRASVNDGTDPNVNKALYTYDWHKDAQGVPVLDKVNIVDWIGGDPSLGEHSANTDWQKVVFHQGIINSHELTLSAGSDKSNFLFSTGYFNNEGLVRYNDYRRYNARLNSSFKMFDGIIKIGENFQLSKSVETPVPSDLGGANVISLAKVVQPIIPVYTTLGDYSGPIGAGFSDRNNPLHMLDINQDDKNHLLNVFGNMYVEINPVRHLTLRSNIGVDYLHGYNRNIERTFTEGFLSRTVNSLQIDQNDGLNLTLSNTANYELTMGKSRFNLLAGTEIVKEQSLNSSAYKEGFAIQDVDYFTLNAGTGRAINSGSETGSSLLSYFGKINYNLADKYLVSATLRDDGSSRFGVNNRFGLFPAFSAGWKLSEENFIKKHFSSLSNLKIRAGIGTVGNQDIGNNARFGLYQTNYGGVINGNTNVGTAYDISGAGSGTLQSGYVSLQAENKDLKWESTTETNIGFDFGFFNEKLTGSFDYFNRKTKDILIQPPYAAILGEGKSQWVNGASKSNTGFEVIVNYQNRINDFTYSITANVSSFKDKITYLPNSVVHSYAGNAEKTILGRSQTALFGYVTDGLFQSQAEVAAHATQPGKGIGRIRYTDLNKDGKIDPFDQDWLGNQLPDFTYGLNINLSYKHFSFAAFFQGVQGIYVFNGVKSQTDFVGAQSGTNYGIRVLDAWTPQNTTSTIPALSLVNANNETRTSNYFIENASYMKLRNAQLSYEIQYKGLKKIGIASTRVYILGQNLLTIKKTTGSDRFTAPDPENSGNLYPRPTTITFGANLTF